MDVHALGLFHAGHTANDNIVTMVIPSVFVLKLVNWFNKKETDEIFYRGDEDSSGAKMKLGDWLEEFKRKTIGLLVKVVS